MTRKRPISPDLDTDGLIARLRAAQVVRPRFDEGTQFVPFVQISEADRDALAAAFDTLAKALRLIESGFYGHSHMNACRVAARVALAGVAPPSEQSEYRKYSGSIPEYDFNLVRDALKEPTANANTAPRALAALDRIEAAALAGVAPPEEPGT